MLINPAVGIDAQHFLIGKHHPNARAVEFDQKNTIPLIRADIAQGSQSRKSTGLEPFRTFIDTRQCVCLGCYGVFSASRTRNRSLGQFGFILGRAAATSTQICALAACFYRARGNAPTVYVRRGNMPYLRITNRAPNPPAGEMPV